MQVLKSNELQSMELYQLLEDMTNLILNENILRHLRVNPFRGIQSKWQAR